MKVLRCSRSKEIPRTHVTKKEKSSHRFPVVPFLSTEGNPILITQLSGQRDMSGVMGHKRKPVIIFAYFGILISCFAADQALHRFPIIAFELTVPLVLIGKNCNDFAVLPRALDLKAHLLPDFRLSHYNSD